MQSNGDGEIRSRSSVDLEAAWSAATERAYWVPDDTSTHCIVCHSAFTFFKRRSHCRQCGQLVCSSCSTHKALAKGYLQPTRVCDPCYKTLTGGPVDKRRAASTIVNAHSGANFATLQPSKNHHKNTNTNPRHDSDQGANNNNNPGRSGKHQHSNSMANLHTEAKVDTSASDTTPTNSATTSTSNNSKPSKWAPRLDRAASEFIIQTDDASDNDEDTIVHNKNIEVNNNSKNTSERLSRHSRTDSVASSTGSVIENSDIDADDSHIPVSSGDLNNQPVIHKANNGNTANNNTNNVNDSNNNKSSPSPSSPFPVTATRPQNNNTDNVVANTSGVGAAPTESKSASDNPSSAAVSVVDNNLSMADHNKRRSSLYVYEIVQVSAQDIFNRLWGMGGSMMLVDTRSEDDYKLSHIPRALHLPMTHQDITDKADLSALATKVNFLERRTFNMRTRMNVIVYGGEDGCVQYLAQLMLTERKASSVSVLVGGYQTFHSKYPFLACGMVSTPNASSRLARHNHIPPFPGYPNEILPDFLYLGSYTDAKNVAHLQSLQIKHILNASGECNNEFPDQFNYLQISLSDEESQDIQAHLAQAYQFLFEAKQKNERVLIHCQMGVSRSVSLLIAYLMQAHDWSLKQAFTTVQKHRKQVMPNNGFWRQLSHHEQHLYRKKHGHVNGYTSTLEACIDLEAAEKKTDEIRDMTTATTAAGAGRKSKYFNETMIVNTQTL